MEELKAYSDLLEPDERWANFVLRNPVTSELSHYTFKKRYETISAIKLIDSVPEDVKSQFNTALMLGIYAWLYYPFHQIAELKAFSTLEMALRHKFSKNRSGLFKLLKLAVDSDLITDVGFSHIEFFSEDPKKYSSLLPKLISDMRNDLAHGSTSLHPGSGSTLSNCAEIINQIFS